MNRPFQRQWKTVLALAAFPILLTGCPGGGGGGGGGGGTGSTSLGGDWNYLATTSDTCFSDPGYEEQDSALVEQTGSSITITTLSVELTGTISGSHVTLSGDDTLFHHEMDLVVSSNGNTMSGTDSWGFFFGPACSGTSHIQIQR